MPRRRDVSATLGDMTLDLLLVVQAHDSAIDRLTHQRANLPAFAALAECDDERSHLERAREVVVEQRHELAREQKRREDEVALIADRRSAENDRLYSGEVTAHKDLQAIQAELDVLADRQAALEDDVLELMEDAEPLDAQLEDFDAKLADVATRRKGIEQSIVEAQAEIDGEMETEAAARSAQAAEIDPGLLDEYERVRAACGGVGVARLNSKTCEGCHLQLSAVAFDRIRKEPGDATVHCPECRRILVR